MQQNKVSRLTLQRLPMYLTYLKGLADDGRATISAAAIAEALELGEVQVRKDLAAVSVAGKPKVGYLISDLKQDLEKYLGCRETTRAVLAGCGMLGRAILSFEGLAEYGVEICAAFEKDAEAVGTKVCGVPVYAAEEMEAFCRDNGVRMGVITVPAKDAQACMEAMVSGGVTAVWNFAPTHLFAPEGVLVHREDMLSSLAVLSHHTRQNDAENE